jgi:general stress protein 26
MNMDEYVTKAKQIIAENIYCTVATASLEAKPWISPVFYAYDDQYNIYWVSDKNALHSKNIKANPQGAVVIFNSQAPEGEGDGVYIDAKVEEVIDEKEIEYAINMRNMRVTMDEFKVKNSEEITGEGAWRMYKATPLKISKLTEGEYVNGQYIDKRIDFDLKVFSS